MKVKQFVTFRIDRHLLGLDILRVGEINRSLNITPVPTSSDYVRGLINLRGQIVTVFDLGVRLGLPPRSVGPETHNVILKGDTVALLVDDIGDVIQVGDKDLEPPPANVAGLESEFIEGVVQLDRELLVVLSAPKLTAHPNQADFLGFPE